MPVQSQQLPLWKKVLKCFIIIKLHNTLWVNYLYGRRSQPQRLHVWNVRMSAFIDLIMLRLVCPFSRSWSYNQIISVSSVFDKLKLKKNKQASELFHGCLLCCSPAFQGAILECSLEQGCSLPSRSPFWHSHSCFLSNNIFFDFYQDLLDWDLQSN